MFTPKGFTETSDGRGPRLDVVSGIHEGVSVPLESDVCSLGASEDDDIILRDARVNKGHATIRIYGKKLAVEASGGDVSVDGQWLSKGVGCRATFPVTIGIGDASLRLHQLNESYLFNSRQQFSDYLNNRIVRSGIMGALAFLFSGVLFYQIIDVNAEPNIIQQATEPNEQQEESSSEDPLATQEIVVKALTDKITDYGLSNLSVSTSERRIIASGRLSPEERSTWTSVHQWFDRNYGRHYMLSSAIEYTETARPDINFQAVWLGESPYVIGPDGKRLYAGASLVDGWVIEEITVEKVMLRRGDDRFNLTL